MLPISSFSRREMLKRVGAGFGAARRPRGKRELEDERHRKFRLVHDHRARFDQCRALALGRGKEAIFAPTSFGCVEPADDSDRRVGDDATLDLARRLLRTDENDSERTTSLGDVEQYLLDRTGTLARGVLVQLVEYDELQWSRGP